MNTTKYAFMLRDYKKKTLEKYSRQKKILHCLWGFRPRNAKRTPQTIVMFLILNYILMHIVTIKEFEVIFFCYWISNQACDERRKIELFANNIQQGQH